MTTITWQPIPGPCPRCGADGTCYRAGHAVACRFSTSGDIRIHAGYPVDGTSRTYALTGVDADTPDFPGCISEYTAILAGGD
jgi:hypothetical protein